VITTYRCNARCAMCHVWKNPTKVQEEFSPDILKKLPSGIRRLNITGGEPTLRADLNEIVRILQSKTNHLEISTNGYLTNVLDRITREFPELVIRISIEGFPEQNDRLRGLKNGFDRALRSFLKCRENGVSNLGFAMTISGENCRDLLDVYRFCVGLECQLANAIVHNSFYFHKEDNSISNRDEVERILKDFVTMLLNSNRRSIRSRLKDWFRGYINAGLLDHMRGARRDIPCGAARDSFFVDPYGRVLACNGSAEPWIMGDLNRDTFEDIWHSSQAEEVRELVDSCDRNCWMTGNAVPAMRKSPLKPIVWVMRSKFRLMRRRGLRL